MSQTVDLVSHIDIVTKNLSNSGYQMDKIADIIQKISTNYENIDRAIRSKGWKFLVQNFLDKNEQNTFFYTFGDVSAISVDMGNGLYNVAFAFKNPKDEYDKDWRKYAVYNYFKKKYYKEGIKASCALNAIVIAYNVLYVKFHKRFWFKVTTNLIINFVLNNENLVSNLEDYTIPDFLKKPYQMYKQAREEFMEKYHCTASDFRFYYFSQITAVVLRKNDGTYTVTFAFKHPKDAEYIDRAVPDQMVKHIDRYCALKNFMDGRYTYECNDAPNSMSACCRIFNLKKKEFPSFYRDAKMSVVIEPTYMMFN